MSTGSKADHEDPEVDAIRSAPGRAEAKEPWLKPEITSFKPVTAARGVYYLPNDGVSNLTP